MKGNVRKNSGIILIALVIKIYKVQEQSCIFTCYIVKLL